MIQTVKKIYRFYYDGFKQMKVGKKLWLIIALKLFILLVIVKWLFFPDIMQTHFTDDTQRSNYILDHLTQIKEK
ncbi:MAG: DUF4492 domain-containing protein [Sulfurovum sp.]|nr:DUF4492 domain-containing protein [Sulfurovum sp.]